MLKCLTLVAALSLVPGLALADTTLHFTVKKKDKSTHSTVYVRPGEVRTENGTGTWMLYKAAQDTLYVVQTQRKNYFRVDRARIKQLGKQMAEARQRYKAELEKLPPKQRKQVEKSLGSMLKSPKQKQPLELTKSGGTDQVHGVTCETGKISQGAKTLQSVCIAEPKALGMAPNEFATLKGLYKLMSDLEASTGFGRGPMPDLAHLNGVPVSLMSPEDHESQRLSGVSHKALADKLFKIPADYTQRKAGNKHNG